MGAPLSCLPSVPLYLSHSSCSSSSPQWPSPSLLRSCGCLPTLSSCPPILLSQQQTLRGEHAAAKEIRDSERWFLAWRSLAAARVFWCRDPKVTLLEDSNEMQQNLPFWEGSSTLEQRAEIPEATHLHKEHQRRGWIWSNCSINRCHESEPQWLQPSVPVIVCSRSSSWRRPRPRNCNTEHQLLTKRNSTHNSSHLSLIIWDM